MGGEGKQMMDIQADSVPVVISPRMLYSGWEETGLTQRGGCDLGWWSYVALLTRQAETQWLEGGLCRRVTWLQRPVTSASRLAFQHGGVQTYNRKVASDVHTKCKILYTNSKTHEINNCGFADEIKHQLVVKKRQFWGIGCVSLGHLCGILIWGATTELKTAAVNDYKLHPTLLRQQVSKGILAVV